MTRCACSEFSAPLKSFDDVLERIKSSTEISRTLKHQYLHAHSGLAIWKCSECGADWAEERPYPEVHGGGPSCFFRTPSADGHALSRLYDGEILRWRKNYEDEGFLQGLGDERGPERCAEADCKRLRIPGSLRCRKHHFKMIKGYEPLGPSEPVS